MSAGNVEIDQLTATSLMPLASPVAVGAVGAIGAVGAVAVDIDDDSVAAKAAASNRKHSLRELQAQAHAAPRSEDLSPFVAWSDEERAPLDVDDGAAAPGTSLFVDVLSAPRPMIERIIDPARSQRAIIACLAIVALGTAFFAGVVFRPLVSVDVALSSALLVPAHALFALATSLLPIWAVSGLLAARIPLSRLTGIVLAAAAKGALLLAAGTPLPYLMWKLDDHYAGPLSILGVFGLAGVVAAWRIRSLLVALATYSPDAPDGTIQLSDDVRHRVAMLSERAMFLLAFAFALSMWSFAL